jgi:WhiB family redox-sensing transcriptional regulator
MNHTTSRGLLVPIGEWSTAGLCRSHEADLFFPEGETSAGALAEINRAKAVCRACPVMTRCQDWALNNHEDHGVWGGLSEADRRNLHRRRTRNPDAPVTNLAADTPVKAPPTMQEVFDTRTRRQAGGHILWTRSSPIAVRGHSYTPQQLAFELAYGRPPEGMVRISCDVRGCLAKTHITDWQMRQQRPKKVAA